MKIIILGAGARGNFYAKYATKFGAQIVGVAEPNVAKRDLYCKKYNIPSEGQFSSWEEALAGEKYADAVINSTVDRLHFHSTVSALEKGYHVLLEKPMTPIKEECVEIVELAEKKNLTLMIAHVLRYTPFFAKLKELLDAKIIGEIINFQLTENIAYWHMAHSYVRGNFRNEDLASPWILAKSCHDLDILVYLLGKKCHKVTSIGNLMRFKSENAPLGAPKRCLDGCPVEKTCPYFAPAFYLQQMQEVTWPTSMISTDDSLRGRYEALQTGPYGRCVYHCDNNVPDHQTTIFEFDGGTTASFNMVGFSSGEGARTMRIFGTLGDIRGHVEKGELEINHFLKGEQQVIKIEKNLINSGHSGGDSRLTQDFLATVSGNSEANKSSARVSLQSHFMAFAAEVSRRENRTVIL